MSYNTTLGIETPEPGESPAATGQLKAMAEKIDLLLRKQLTTLVELAKLKVTTSIELPAESLTTTMLKALAVTTAKIAEGAVTAVKLGSEAVTEAKLASGAVTAAKLGAEAVETAKVKTGAVTEAKLASASISDAKVISGRALVATGNSYGTHENVGAGKPSATRFAYVVFEAQFGGPTGDIGYGNITVNGVNLGTMCSPSLTGESVIQCIGFLVPPGQEWVFHATRNVVGTYASTLLL